MFQRSVLFCVIGLLSLSCATSSTESDDDTDSVIDDPQNPLPAWADDCDEAANDALDSAAGLKAIDGKRYLNVQLCDNDLDVYRIDVPPESWVTVKLDIDGSGSGASDFDLFEVEHPDVAYDGYLDQVNDEDPDFNIIWYSATEQPFERLGWYNPTEEPVSHYIVIDGYKGATGTYDLDIAVSEWHDARDCDDVYEDDSESGPCNRIMQFPQANNIDDGYVVSHWAHYSNLRRELAYLVRWAAAETSAAFPDTNPIGLLDMGQWDGDTPGRMEGQLRHPEGTHVNGNDIDIAYYQTGSDNYGRIVCPSHDNYFCTGDPTLLDAPRTAYFMVKLMETPYLRVIGVDPKVATAVKAAAQDLKADGLITSSEVSRLNSYMAYGSGWPFHHHHMHFSWSWESGFTDRAPAPPTGCQHALQPPHRKNRTKIRE